MLSLSQAQASVLRPGVALEFARRPRVMAAGDPDADRAGDETGIAGTLDSVPHRGGVHRGRRTEGGDRVFIQRAAHDIGGEKSCGAPTAQHHLRRRANRTPVSRRPAGASAWSGLQQDPARRRCSRSLGKIFGRDGGQRLHQQRPRMHQHVEHLGIATHQGNRAGHRGESIGSIQPLPPSDAQSSLAAFTVPGAAQAIWKSIHAQMQESGVADMTAPFGQRFVENAIAADLPAAYIVVHCAVARRAAFEYRVHVPLRERGEVSARKNAGEDWTHSGGHRDY